MKRRSEPVNGVLLDVKATAGCLCESDRFDEFKDDLSSANPRQVRN